MYVDPDGRIAWWIIPAIVGVVSGTANVISNWDNIDGFWQGLSTFGMGFGAGAGACFTGNWGLVGMMAYGAVSSAIVSINNDLVAQTGHNFEGMGNVNWDQVLGAAGYGVISGGISAGVSKWAVGANWLGVNGYNSPLARSLVLSPIASAAAHVGTGTIAGVANGQNFADAFGNSFNGIGKTMVTSGIIATGTSIATSYAGGINPFTGNRIYPPNNGFSGQPQKIELKPGQIIDRYGDDKGQYFSPTGTPDKMRSMPPSPTPRPYQQYEVVEPFAVEAAKIAPFYGQSGGGVQYYTGDNITVRNLIDGGYIKPVQL